MVEYRAYRINKHNHITGPPAMIVANTDDQAV
jgi:hypothetical protein